MSVRSAMVLARMAFLFFLAGSPFVPLLAGVYTGHVVSIILAGAFVIAAPLGIVLTRSLQRSSVYELVDRYRELERFYLLAAIASQTGVLMARLGRGTVGTFGIAVSVAGMMTALWLLLRVSPAGSRQNAHYPSPMDQGRRE